MDYTEYQKRLRKNISSISNDRKLEFALDICERLLPEYDKFHRKHNWGDFSVIKRGFELCQRLKNHKDVEQNELRETILQIEANTPDMDNFGDLEGSFALNTACALVETLCFLEDNDDEHIFNVGSFMYDTIDFKANELLENPSEQEIEKHYLIETEIKQQLEKTKYVT